MRYLILLSICIANYAFAQKQDLSYSTSNLPAFLNKNGDTLHNALIGGLNQPQFQAVDLNNDGKKDLVIHDRTGGVFLTFINNGSKDLSKYSYQPAFENCFPKVKKGWMLLTDYDQDGREDLWASIDFKVVLFKNITKIGDQQIKFERISPFLKAYKYSGSPDPKLDTVNIASNFNNIPAIADVDGDGDVDFFSYQANEGWLLLYRNMTKDFNLPLHPPVFDLADLCWGNFKDTSVAGVKIFPCNYKTYRKKHSGGSALLWLDNDNDGDMDLLLGNADAKNIIFLKNGKSDLGLKFDSIISYNGHWPNQTNAVNLNSFPAAFMIDANDDGAKDILVAPNAVEFTSPIEQTNQVRLYKNTGSDSFPNFILETKPYFTNEVVDHGEYTDPILYDIDMDLDLDLILATNGDYALTSNKSFRLVLYRNIGTINTPIYRLENEDLWLLSSDSIANLSLAIGDLNGDAKPDLVTGSLNGSLNFYKNIGSTTNWAFSPPLRNAFGINVGEKSTPQLIDLDKDGRLDLIIGEKDGNFNYCHNSGTKTIPQFTISDDTLGNFITNEFVSDLSPPAYWFIGNASGEIADLDKDGNFEMIFGGEEGRLRFIKFDTYKQATFIEDTLMYFDSSLNKYSVYDCGTNSHPCTGDLNNDGILDIIVGNDRGGLTFLMGHPKTIGIKPLLNQAAPTVFPNPNNGSTLNITKTTAESFIFSIIDLQGLTLYSEVSESGILLHKMNLKNIPNGIYILKSSSTAGVNYYTRILILAL